MTALARRPDPLTAATHKPLEVVTVLVLSLPRPMVEKAFPAVERSLERQPNGWAYIGSRGKLRRFLGDRAGLVDLVAAGDRYLEVFEGKNPDLMTPANLYRLGGAPRATVVLRRMHAPLVAKVADRGHDSVWTGDLIEACFLLGLDEQCQQAWKALRRADRGGVRGTRYGDVAALAKARTEGDVAACDSVVASFDKWVAKERNTFDDTGNISLYDWLEIALVVRAEVSGEPSPRLFEL